MERYVVLSTSIALLATLVAVGVSEAASRTAPEPFRQSATAFRLADFSAAIMDNLSMKAEVAPALPAVEALTAPAAPEAPVEPAPAALEQPAANEASSENEVEATASHFTQSGQAALSKNQVSSKERIENVNLTFYDCKNQGFCGAMYNGRKVYQGAAACSWNLAIGTKFIIVGDPTRRVYVCEDRGLLSNTWVDIFWNDPRDGYKWQAQVGRKGTIEIVGLP